MINKGQLRSRFMALTNMSNAEMLRELTIITKEVEEHVKEESKQQRKQQEAMQRETVDKVPEYIKKLIKQGYTITEIANKAGCDKAHISRISKKSTQPSFDLALKILQVK